MRFAWRRPKWKITISDLSFWTTTDKLHTDQTPDPYRFHVLTNVRQCWWQIWSGKCSSWVVLGVCSHLIDSRLTAVPGCSPSPTGVSSYLIDRLFNAMMWSELWQGAKLETHPGGTHYREECRDAQRFGSPFQASQITSTPFQHLGLPDWPHVFVQWIWLTQLFPVTNCPPSCFFIPYRLPTSYCITDTLQKWWHN